MPKESIGALWLNETKDGEKFFSGHINNVKVVVFKNRYKDKPTKPDYRVFESTPREAEDKEQVPF